jgi:hypothetical protein
MAINFGDYVMMHGANGTFNNMALVEVSLQWTIIGLIYVMHVIL